MTSWSPILSPNDPLGIEAYEAVSVIVEAVFERNSMPLLMKKRLHGAEEEALLLAYWALARNETILADRAIERLNVAIEDVSLAQRHLGLYGGLCSLGWTVQHFSQLFEDPSHFGGETNGSDQAASETGDPIAEIDAAVLYVLRQPKWSSSYDLISGLVGYGVYFLERLPSESAAEGLKLIIGHVASNAERTNDGITWFTPKEQVPQWQRTSFPNGYYNLGTAHGVPGILHLLSEAFAAGIETATCKELLDGAVRWLLSHQAPTDKPYRFYAWMDSAKGMDSRLAWCYGDPGVLAVLLQVAQRTGRCDLHEFTLRLLDDCLARPIKGSGVEDAPLCHGAAGVAHLFNRIYHSEGDRRCLEAALAWLKRSLDMRQPGAGVGGFLQLTKPDPDGPVVWEPSAAFLDGSIGIALALLAALTPIEPQWDRLLLISGRSVANGQRNCRRTATTNDKA